MKYTISAAYDVTYRGEIDVEAADVAAAEIIARAAFKQWMQDKWTQKSDPISDSIPQFNDSDFDTDFDSFNHRITHIWGEGYGQSHTSYSAMDINENNYLDLD